MTIHEWLLQATKKLQDASIPTARLDAEVLLANALDEDRSWLHAHSGHSLQGSTLYNIDEQIIRRMKHEPIAYILGKKEFYGREFIVNSDTLQPRPETETMIELLTKLVNSQQSTVGNKSKLQVIDIGTGSGCIAITVKLELPDCEVTATDISEACLSVARENAEILGAEITVTKSNLLEDINIKDIADSILCCNLPYVPDKYEINESARYEPALALFGGEDGLDYYRELFTQLSRQSTVDSRQRGPKYVLTESLKEQHTNLAKFAELAGYELTESRDLVQVFEKR